MITIISLPLPADGLDGPPSNNSTDTAAPAHAAVSEQILDTHAAVIRRAWNGDFSDSLMISDLPRRGNSTRAIADALARDPFPGETPIKAAIMYEELVKPLKKRAHEERSKPVVGRTNKWGRMAKAQGPWQGQELDPVSLEGPIARLAPVKTVP